MVAGTPTKIMSIGPNNPNTTTGFIDGYTTTATAAGTTTLTVLSTMQQFFTGVTTQTVTLPVTSTLILGQTYRIFNASTGAVTVKSSGANSIVVIPANSSAVLTCILTSGTSAASWSAAASAGVYLEGTFTPAFSATSAVFSYASQVGLYVKHGREVTVMITLSLNGSGNTFNGNDLFITGLPFAGTAPAVQYATVSWSNSTSSFVNMQALLLNNSTSLRIIGITAAVTNMYSVLANNALLGNSGGMSLNLTYIAGS
jgi:hypothetical protein